MKNNLLPIQDYPVLSIFVISSSKRIFCDLCDLQKSQTVCLTNMAWTAFSTADTCINCAKCGKGFKFGTNEAYNIQIKIWLGGISKLFCICSHANMAASDKGISLKRKFLKKFLLNFKN